MDGIALRGAGAALEARAFPPPKVSAKKLAKATIATLPGYKYFIKILTSPDRVVITFGDSTAISSYCNVEIYTLRIYRRAPVLSHGFPLALSKCLK